MQLTRGLFDHRQPKLIVCMVVRDEFVVMAQIALLFRLLLPCAFLLHFWAVRGDLELTFISEFPQLRNFSFITWGTPIKMKITFNSK